MTEALGSRRVDEGVATTAGGGRDVERVDCAVVVVTYNSGRDISGLLESLPAAADGLSVRVVVVDNGSTDATIDLVREDPATTCVEIGANLGYAGAINVGRRLVRPCSSVLVVNPDLRLEPGSVRHLFNALGDPAVGVAVPMLFDGNGRQFRSLRREPRILGAFGDALLGNRMARRPAWSSETVHDEAEYDRRHAVDWATGAVLLVSERCDAAVGDWDDDRFFLYSEETDFATRVRSAGFRIDYVPDAKAHHRGGGSGQSDALVALMAVNRIRYYEKHHRRPASSVFRSGVILGELLRSYERAHRRALGATLRRASWPRLPHRTGLPHAAPPRMQ